MKFNRESLSPEFRKASEKEQIEAIKRFFKKNKDRFSEEELRLALLGLQRLRKEDKNLVTANNN